MTYVEADILRANGILPQPIQEGNKGVAQTPEKKHLLRIEEEKKTVLRRGEKKFGLSPKEENGKPDMLSQSVLDLTAENAVDDKTRDIKSLDATIRVLQRKRAALEPSSPSASVPAVISTQRSLQPPTKRIKRASSFLTRGDIIDLT